MLFPGKGKLLCYISRKSLKPFGSPASTTAETSEVVFWGSAQANEFKKVKQILVSSQVLVHYDPSKQEQCFHKSWMMALRNQWLLPLTRWP